MDIINASITILCSCCPACHLHHISSLRMCSKSAFPLNQHFISIKLLTVIQRAQELIAVGQTQAALTVLHEHVTSKRTRNSPIASLEPVMLLFVELSVDLRKGKSAKDGLYQYKNIAQNSNVGTIEVIKHFPSCATNMLTNLFLDGAEEVH